MLSIAHSTILVIYYIRTVALKMTGFFIIIVCKIKTIGFKMTGFTTIMTKLKSFLKRTISTYIAGGLTKMAFWSVVC